MAAPWCGRGHHRTGLEQADDQTGHRVPNLESGLLVCFSETCLPRPCHQKFDHWKMEAKMKWTCQTCAIPRVETVKWTDDTWVYIATGLQIVWFIDMCSGMCAGNKVKPKIEEDKPKEARLSKRQLGKRVCRLAHTDRPSCCYFRWKRAGAKKKKYKSPKTTSRSRVVNKIMVMVMLLT